MNKINFVGGLAIIALILAVCAWVRSERSRELNEAEVAKIEKRVYQKLLHEAWQEVKPVYMDFGVKVDDPPASFGALIRPLVSVQSPASTIPGNAGNP